MLLFGNEKPFASGRGPGRVNLDPDVAAGAALLFPSVYPAGEAGRDLVAERPVGTDTQFEDAPPTGTRRRGLHGQVADRVGCGFADVQAVRLGVQQRVAAPVDSVAIGVQAGDLRWVGER
ncbi:hypothetical protein AB0H37_05075 [Actinomadura sp. NPDC023710]|uniref:hypothetical protein n=1 Tax=Actinomadura sp. NPDC023710 TaxID=3158219 RepID=UPI0033EF2A90